MNDVELKGNLSERRLVVKTKDKAETLAYLINQKSKSVKAKFNPWFL